MTLYKYPKIERFDKVNDSLKDHDHVLVQEKIDGSNVSFYYDGDKVVFQSRNTIISADSPGMFLPFIQWVRSHENTSTLDWMKGGSFIVYGEMMGNGKIKYNNPLPFVGFDIYNRDQQQFLPHADWIFDEHTIPRLPTLYRGPLPSREQLITYLNAHAYGEKSEGIVIKGYNVQGHYASGPDEVVEFVSPLVGGKIVHDEYKELKQGKTSIRDVNDPVTKIIESVVTEARVAKARQRMYERGNMNPQPHELIKLVATDVMEEEREYIKDQLFKANGKALSSALAKQVLALSETHHG